MEHQNLPLACNLTEPKLQERKSSVLETVKNAVLEVKELDLGYAYRFPSDVVWIAKLAKLITNEHLCCPFLRFSLVVEPADGPVWLELSGPAGTKDFLNSLFF